MCNATSPTKSREIDACMQIGAWMIESPLGRRKSLALSTFVTAMCCFAFVQVQSKSGVMWSTIGVSLSSTVMWAVLYGMTPEIFDTKGKFCYLTWDSSRLSEICQFEALRVGQRQR
jgi:hypothetical protein